MRPGNKRKSDLKSRETTFQTQNPFQSQEIYETTCKIQEDKPKVASNPNPNTNLHQHPDPKNMISSKIVKPRSNNEL